jgi:Tfp pilus assembly protein PilN
MDINIDFLKQTKPEKEGFKVRKEYFIFSAAGLVVLYLLGVIGIFGYKLYLNRQLARISSDTVTAEQGIKTLDDLELMTVLLNEKTKSLKDILKSKKHHHQVADYLFSIVPPGVSINGFTITADNTLTFSGRADSPKSLKLFLDNIKNKQTGELVLSRVAISGLTLSKEAESGKISYALGIALQFLP